jgi:NitT/TauT family transport system ATP-binding protein
VPIDLPRPRTLHMMTESHFGEFVDRIRGQLDKGALL